MADSPDPSEKAMLYSEMLREAERLGDHHLQFMARNRLEQTRKGLRSPDSRGDVIPFPRPVSRESVPVRHPQRLWSIVLQSAMIPVGMAAILFAFIQASLHIYSGPLLK